MANYRWADCCETCKEAHWISGKELGCKWLDADVDRCGVCDYYKRSRFYSGPHPIEEHGTDAEANMRCYYEKEA